MKAIQKTHVRASVKIVVTSILLGCAVTAQAASISFITSWSTTRSISSGSNTDNRSDSLNDYDYRYISQFDASLGTLQSIGVNLNSMSLYSGANANFRDDTLWSTVGGYQALQNMRVSFAMPGFSFTRYGSPATRSDGCSYTSGLTSSSSCSTSISGVTYGLASYSATLTNSTALAGFTGLASTLINIYQYATLYTNETDGDNGYVNSRSGKVSASGSIQITYNYAPPAPVPLPAAVWLFGSGLLGLAGIAGRRAVC